MTSTFESNDSPIGVFDSGVGGLSLLRAIRKALPRENLVYVADNAHAPYGDRDDEFIAERADRITRLLVASGVKAIVVACNTASVVAIANLRSRCPHPLVAIEPAIKPAAIHSKSGVIGVLATSRTIASPSVARLCALFGGETRILLKACPGLVERVEQGMIDSADTRALLAEYLSPLIVAGADTIVLGCTHYPFLESPIREIVGPDVVLFDPAEAVARELVRRLGTDRVNMHSTKPAHETFYSSAPSNQVISTVSSLWKRRVFIQDLASLSTPMQN